MCRISYRCVSRDNAKPLSNYKRDSNLVMAKERIASSSVNGNQSPSPREFSGNCVIKIENCPQISKYNAIILFKKGINNYTFWSFTKNCSLFLGPPSSMGRPFFRIIVVSSRARNKLAIYASVLPNVIVMEYSYETHTLHNIAELIKSVLIKVCSLYM